MADRFYGANRGAERATTAASQQNTDVELIVDDAVGFEKKDVLLILERIKDAILQDDGFTTGG